jgi:hypothetical protein
MKNLLILVVLIVIAYYLYTSGVLSRAVQTQPDPNQTPEIYVTVYSPFGHATPTAAPPSIATARPANGEAATPTLLPAATEAVQPPTIAAVPTDTATPPPPTIVIPPVPPTLAVAATPTPSAGFTLTLETPHDGETVNFTPLLVIGQTEPNAIVSVNDTVGLANADGRFSLAVPLEEGPNVLEVIASNKAGEQTSLILTVLYQP